MADLILTFGGTKGGSGKSTHAINAAIQSTLDGRRTLLIDADEQASSYDFTLLRGETDAPAYTCTKLTLHAGASVKGFRDQILRQAEAHDRVIIDVGGRDTAAQRVAMAVSHILAIPVVPSQLDAMTISTIAVQVEEARTINPDLIAYGYLNEARPQGVGTENEDTATVIREHTALSYLDTPVRQYQAFRHAASQGLGVMELKHPQRNDMAVQDLAQLHAVLFTITTTKKGRKTGGTR